MPSDNPNPAFTFVNNLNGPALNFRLEGKGNFSSNFVPCCIFHGESGPSKYNGVELQLLDVRQEWYSNPVIL